MCYTYTSLAELQACKCFKSCVTNLGTNGEITNMRNERFFAAIKKATPANLPHAERLLAAGLLTQWLRPHLAEGGSDPRITTRSEMIDAGVPIQANKPKKGMRGGLQPSVAFSNDEVSKVKKARLENNEAHMSRTERADLARKFIADFPQQPEDIQSRYVEQVQDSRDGRRTDRDTNTVEDDVYDSARRWNMCNKTEPISMDRLNRVFADKAASGNVGGLSRKMSDLRGEFANYSVFSDMGDIPSDTRVTYFAHCAAKHRGLCMHHDRCNYKLALHVGNLLNDHLLNKDRFSEGDWFSTSVVRAKQHEVLFFYLAHQRWKDPKIALLTHAESYPQPDGSLKLEYRCGDVLDHITPYGIAKSHLKGNNDTTFDLLIELFGVGNFSVSCESELRAFCCVKVLCSKGEVKLHDSIEDAELFSKNVGKPGMSKSDKSSGTRKDNDEQKIVVPTDRFSEGFDAMIANDKKQDAPTAPKVKVPKQVSVRVDPMVKQALKEQMDWIFRFSPHLSRTIRKAIATSLIILMRVISAPP